jgi:hypothetical protein
MIEGCAAKHIVRAESRKHQQHCNQVTARDADVDLAGNFVWDDAFLDTQPVLPGLGFVERTAGRHLTIVS